MLEVIGIDLERREIPLDPDGQSVSNVVTIRNNGSIIDEFRLRVEGLDASASRLAPEVIRLFPRTEATALLTVTAGRGALAGTHHFRIVASSSRDATLEAAVAATLRIGAIGRVELELVPTRLHGRRRASGRLHVRNERNAHAPLRLVAVDSRALLRFDMGQPEFVLAPGAASMVRLHVRLPRGPLIGAPREHEFAVNVLDADAPLAAPLAGVSGVVVQPPFAAWLAGLVALIGGWALTVLMLLLLVGVGIWYLGAPGEPSAVQQPVAAGEAAAGGAGVDETGDAEGAAPALPALPQAAGGALSIAASTQAGDAVALPNAATPVAIAATPTPQPPVIARFGLAAPAGEPSPVVPLQWAVRGADSVRVEQGAPPADAATLGYDQVERRDFTLTASNQVGQTVQSLSVYVLRPPSIEEFRVDRMDLEVGQSVYLVWRTARAVRAFLDDAPLEGSLVEAGSVTLEVPETHTFTLRAENGAGEVQQSVTVRVTAPTPTPVPTVSPTPTARPPAR